MAIEPFEINSIGHLFGGILSRIVIFPNNRITSLLVGYLIHLIIELLENNYCPKGKKLESNINHISDLIFYLLGWLFADYIYCKLKINHINIFLYVFLLILFTYYNLKEIMREVLPYNKFFGGAFL